MYKSPLRTLVRRGLFSICALLNQHFVYYRAVMIEPIIGYRDIKSKCVI